MSTTTKRALVLSAAALRAERGCLDSSTLSAAAWNDYALGPDFSTGKIPSILIGNPMVTGAVRMDHRSVDLLSNR